MNKTQNVVAVVHETRCVRCGACIVQCPFDALHFESPDGGKIDSEVLRRFKLNLFGNRIFKTNRKDLK